MRILEVRDGFIKLETEEKISISSFLQINDTKRYIAQVIQSKRTENSTIAFAKILFLYDGTLKNYDKSLPSKSAEISEFTFDILSQSLEYTTPIVAGKFIDGSIDIPIDSSCFDKKMFISIDNPKINNRVISNLSKQFAYLGKVLIIDMLGITEGQKYVAGVDFKLPLNTESLNFMYEDCLNDATSDSKSLIKEIFNDLSEYSKTVPFLPFDALKSIVDDMVDKQHVFKLLVLKNKLTKFAQQGYFAATAKDAQNLNRILDEQNVVIDLSKLDTIFQNRYLETIYSLIDNKTQVFIEASNALNKKNIKNILEKEDISAVFVTHSKFKYINEIKSMFDNFIIEPTFANNETFKIYSAFLNSMPKETYLLVGEGTNYIPLVSSLEAIINIPVTPEEVISQEPEPTMDLELENTENEAIVEELPQEEVEKTVDFEEELLQEDKDESIQLEESEIVQTEPEIIVEDAIEQKADELINKIAEESSIEVSEESNLFEDEDEEHESLEIEEDIDNTVEEPLELEETSLETIEPTVIEPEVIQEEELEDELNIDSNLDSNEVEQSFTEEFHTDVDEIQTIEIPEDISELADEVEMEEEIPANLELEEPASISEEINESFENKINSDNDSVEFKEYTEEPEVIPLDETDKLDEIVELDESDIDTLGEDAILVELEDEQEEALDEESLDKQIVEDVDKVFTTMKEDSISDSDLDFIDELNSEEELKEISETEEISLDDSIEELPVGFDDEGAEDEGFLEPLEEVNEPISLEDPEEEILETRNSKTPIVPVYDADIPQEDIVMSDPIEQGDVVVHAKYGSGTVEKMIKYGTKTLFSINFDNVGRRLLDPTLTEIKKG